MILTRITRLGGQFASRRLASGLSRCRLWHPWLKRWSSDVLKSSFRIVSRVERLWRGFVNILKQNQAALPCDSIFLISVLGLFSLNCYICKITEKTLPHQAKTWKMMKLVSLPLMVRTLFGSSLNFELANNFLNCCNTT